MCTNSAPKTGAINDRPASSIGPQHSVRRSDPARCDSTRVAAPACTSRRSGSPVVALDAAFAMLPLARDAAPDAWCVQADLEALPFRRGSVEGSWARASYLHIERTRLPGRLLQLHHVLAVGAPAAFTFRYGDGDGPLDDDDFPGRFFAAWQPDALGDVLVGAGFEVHECAPDHHDREEWIHVRATRARTLPDVVGPGMQLLVCGLNPSVYSADVGVGFGRPGNRFWPAALRAGPRVPGSGSARRAHRPRNGNDRSRQAARRRAADALTRDEYRAGAARVERLVRWLRPGRRVFRRARRVARGDRSTRRGGGATGRLRRCPGLRDAQHQRASTRGQRWTISPITFAVPRGWERAPSRRARPVASRASGARRGSSLRRRRRPRARG